MPDKIVPKSKPVNNILLVEDQGEIGLILNMILDEKNLKLDFVNSLLAADEYLQRQIPPLIILDNKLPDGFGVDFIPYIRKKHPEIKIIMLSGFTAARDVALVNGADMFFEKPFNLEEFSKALDDLLADK